MEEEAGEASVTLQPWVAAGYPNGPFKQPQRPVRASSRRPLSVVLPSAHLLGAAATAAAAACAAAAVVPIIPDAHPIMRTQYVLLIPCAKTS